MLASLLLGGVAFAFGLAPKIQNHKDAAAQSKELATTRVHVVTAAPAVEQAPLTLSGELKPATEAAIVARVTGYVRKWYVDLGDTVVPGQLLAELDTPELQKELIRAKAQLALAEAARNLAETTAKRWKELLASKSTAEQDTDEKQADLQLKIAAKEAASAEVQRLEEISRFSQITAPFAGTITARKIDLGQLVETGTAHEMFRLAETAKLRAFVRVPQSYSRSIKPGQIAEVLLPEIFGEKFEAKVVRTAGAIEASSRTLLCELEINNDSGKLLAGSYVQVRITGAKEQRALTVPANALIFRANGAQLATVDSQNHISLKHVVLGKDFGSVVEILEGISAQDRIVPNPPDSLTDGSAVEVAP